MPKRRELPRDFSEYGEDDDEPYVTASVDTPINEFDALMRAAPFDDPRRDIEQLLPLREVLNQAIEQLDDQERWIFDALIVRRLSVRQLAQEIAMPKSSVHRWKDRACARLAELLAEDPIVKEYLRG